MSAPLSVSVWYNSDRVKKGGPIMNTRNFTAVVQKENGGYVANSPEAGITSNGATIEEALANLKEAVKRILGGASLIDEDRPLVTSFGVQDNETEPRLKTFTGKQLLESGIVGMWADRTDIGDSVEFARKLRREAERRTHE